MRFNLVIPNKNKQFLCEPAVDLWDKTASQNAKNREKWGFSVGPKSGREFRITASHEILRLAENFSKRWNLDIPKKSPESFIFMTGHQPEFFHPGVWVKNFLINKTAFDKNIISINFWMDTDEISADYLETPVFEKRINKIKIPLFFNHKTKVFCKMTVPSKKLWDNIKKQVLPKIKTLRIPSLKENFIKYHKIASGLINKVSNLGEFMALSRRFYEQGDKKSLNYLELPLSEVIKSKSFLAFLLDIANKSKNFLEIYNQILDNYRKTHKIHSSAQPFPNLRTIDSLLELPFWIITPTGERKNLWVDISDKTLWCQNKKILALDDNLEKNYDELIKSGYIISFKAVTLTIFMRLFASDLFLHGLGGSKYDLITNQIIHKFYSVQPPSFAVASLTLNLPFNIAPADFTEKDNLEKQLWLIKHNPQKLFSEEKLDIKPEIKNLIVQKDKILVKIQTVSGEEKNTLTQEIKQINLNLEKELHPLKEEFKNKLKSLSEKSEEYKIATFREYPFCFFNPEELRSIVNG